MTVSNFLLFLSISFTDGFQRITRGNDAGGYYHELFLRGKEFLCKQMSRTKIKGTGYKAASSPDQEPDFWSMKPVNPITPPHSDESSVEEEEEQELPPSTCFSVSSPNVPTSFSFELPKPKPEEMEIEPIPLSESSSHSSSEILDEVVDELFLSDQGGENTEEILDFVNTWNPDAFLGGIEEEEIVDDAQLGMLLERILE